MTSFIRKFAALFWKEHLGAGDGHYSGPPDAILQLSLKAEVALKDAKLFHRVIGELQVPTGELIACDPFVLTREQASFTAKVPTGNFPVRLSIWADETDQRVAFASINFCDTEPKTWEMLTVKGQSLATLREGEIFGYGVDSGTGCFMDAAALEGLLRQMESNEEWFQELIDEMDKTYRHTWSWLDRKMGDADLVAFSSGFGDGFYASYVGRDASGNVCTVVTDFGICD
jgi:hypothetical protein